MPDCFSPIWRPCRRALGAVRRGGQRGFTLLETLTATSLFSIMLLGGVTLMLNGVSSYERDITRTSAEADVGRAIRVISEQLRQAVTVTVDSGGQGLTYTLPARQSDGSLVVPITSDGISRRIYRTANGRHLAIDGMNQTSTPLRTLILVEDLAPVSVTGPLFNLSLTNRALTIGISSRVSTGQETFTPRKTEIVKIRNNRI